MYAATIYTFTCQSCHKRTTTHTHTTAYIMLAYVTQFCIISSTFFFAVYFMSLFKCTDAFASISIIMRKHALVNFLKFSQHMSTQSLSAFGMQTLLSELRSRLLLRSVRCLLSVSVSLAPLSPAQLSSVASTKLPLGAGMLSQLTFARSLMSTV